MKTLSRKAKWQGYAINLLLFVAIVAGIRFWQQRDMPQGSAPILSGITLTGQEYKLPAHPDRPVLVHFWGTWCAICRFDQGSIDAIAHDHADTITIAMQSGTAQQVAQHMSEEKLNFPVINDPDGRIAASWGVRAVPANFVIDREGKIRFVEVGYTTELGLRLRLWLAGM